MRPFNVDGLGTKDVSTLDKMNAQLPKNEQLKPVKDPSKVQAKLTKQEYIDFRNMFGQFERDAVKDSQRDVSLIEAASGLAPAAFEQSRAMQDRNLSRFGGELTPAQQQAREAAMDQDVALGTSNAINQAALAQRDINTNRLYNLIDIGNQVYRGASSQLSQAAALDAQRSAANKAASEQRKAQRTAGLVTGGLVGGVIAGTAGGAAAGGALGMLLL